MDSAIVKNHHQLKKNVPQLKPGDRVRVHQKIKEGNKERVQVFEGLVIKTQHGTGINGTFTVRRISLNIGIEKTFPLHLPTIVKIEKLRSAKVRRAKLYYVRGLIGKRAQRLKKEKEDAAVWEDIITEKEPEKAESEAQEEETEEIKPGKEEQSPADEEKKETEKEPTEEKAAKQEKKDEKENEENKKEDK